MQGQRSSIESFPETLEFDHRSSSSTAGMDQDHWSSVLLHQAETQNLPNYLLSPSDTNMSFVNTSTEDSSSLSIWDLGGPSSAGHSLDQENHDETKMELGWPASPIDGGSAEADSMLSLEDVDINLNSTQIDDDQSFSFSLSSNVNEISQDLNRNASHLGDAVSESGLFSHPYVPSLLEHEHSPSSSNPHESSSGIVGFMSGDYDNRPGSSIDGRRLACKRKNIEGLPGQSLASGSTNFFHASQSNPVHSVSVGSNANFGINLSSASRYIPHANSSGEQLNPRFSTMTRGAALNGYPAATVAGNAESSQRNFRVRINPFFHTSQSNPVHSVSVGTNANSGINLSSPSRYIPHAISSGEQLNPRFSTMTRGADLNGYPVATVAGNAESSQRNFRARINPARQHEVYPPNLSSSRDTVTNSSIWLPNEPSSNLMPFNQSLESRPLAAGSSSQNQPHMPVIPGLPRHANLYPWHGPSGSRNGSSVNSINSAETLTTIREDPSSRNTQRNDVPVQSLLVHPREIRNLAQDSANWNVANGNANIAGATVPISRAGTSSSVHSSLGPTWIPHQNPPSQFSRGLAEAVRRALLASESRGQSSQSSNLLSQRSGHSSTSQEVGHQSGSVSRGNQQQSHRRQTLLLDRQSDGVPISIRSLAAREGRSRMISEIRNALDLMRRGENLRFEDVFMLDHPVFHGVADLHDRHRDMRLDVDNMSYEELLALEERIGNVSTGLGEETILKCLKQRKHFSIGVGTTDTEPCCICQEEYVEGEDLGMLDCGHDFHTACIKQWLTHKNLCPICKMTAFVA